MKWIKHFTTAHRSNDLKELVDNFGMEGYGVYWAVLEQIGEQFISKNELPEITLSARNWRKVTEFSPKKWQLFLNFSAEKSLFYFKNFQKNGKTYTTVRCDKLFELHDEYARKCIKKSGQAPDSCPESPLTSNFSLLASSNNTINIDNRDSVIDPDTGEVIQECI